MAENPIPKDLELMFALGEDMADGLATHAATIGIFQNTEARVRTDLAAARTAYENFINARANKRTLVTAQTLADSNGKAFILSAVGVLKNFLGTSWSEAWEPAGFINESLAMPSTLAARQTVLAALGSYFTGHATHENAPLGVTAVIAGTRFTALSDARSAVNNALADVGTKKVLRDAAVRTLYKRMRGLIDELGQLLEDDDPRWPAFGLVPPGASLIPDPPDSLILVAGPGLGTLQVDWADVPLATRYRVFKQVVGVDADFVHVVTVTESDAEISGLPPGATVRVRVTSANDAGESAPSATAEIVMPT